MKNLFIKIELAIMIILLVFLTVEMKAQNPTPTPPCDISKCPSGLLSVSCLYGIGNAKNELNNTLSGEIQLTTPKHIILGTGYSWELGDNGDGIKDEAMYFIGGYEFNKFIGGARVGLKQLQDGSNFLYGGFIGYKLTNTLNVELGIDNFNYSSLGLSVYL